MTCPHKTFTLIEQGTWYTSHHVFGIRPGFVTHDNEPGAYDGSLRVMCHDCGFDRQYTRKKVPKRWKQALDEVMNHG